MKLQTQTCQRHAGAQRALLAAPALPTRPLPFCGNVQSSALRQREHRTLPGTCGPRGLGLATRVAQVERPVVTESKPPATQTEPAQQPAQVDWFNAWYPIAFEKDVAKDVPYRMELLSIPLVVWWDPKTSSWNVFEDICPHRLVPLSEGRINGRGNLECGYHGWEFSKGGKCENIPQGGQTASRRACVRAFPCVERQGLLWVKPQALPNAHLAPPGSDAALAAAAAVAADAAANIPIVPELENPEWARGDVWRDLPFGYEMLMENVLDVSHVPFTHHKSMSNRNMIGDFKIKLEEPVSVNGFEGAWPTGPRAGKLGPQTTEFNAPCYMKHRIDASKLGFEALTVVYCVPTSPGRCRLINRNCQLFTKAKIVKNLLELIPKWWGHISAHILLEDDQIFLHIGEKTYLERRKAGLNNAQACYMPSPADTMVNAFRTWLDKFAGGGPFGPLQDQIEATGPRWSKEQLLDRYTYHTANCATCQKGLAKVRSWQSLAWAVRALTLGAALITVSLAVALGPAAGAALSSGAVDVASGVSPEGGVVGTAAQCGLAAVRWLALGSASVGGADTVTHLMVRAVGWLVSAGAAHFILGKLRYMEQLFYKGTYPPMRNTAKDGP